MDDLKILREAWEQPAPAAAPARATARARLLGLADAGGAGQAAAHERRVVRLPRMRPRLVAAGATATVIAAGAAVAVSMAATAPTTATGGPPAVTTAYVIKHTERALAAVQRGSAIQQTRFTAAGHLLLGANLTPPQRSPAWLGHMRFTQVITWSYHGRTRVAGLGAGGILLLEAGPSTATRPLGHEPPPRPVLVSRPAASWFHPLSMPPPAQLRMTCRGSSQALYDGPFMMSLMQDSPAGWTALIREALSCGLFKLDGRQRVDGVDAIRLTATPEDVKRQKGAHEKLWVNPKTFLPVRMSFGLGAATADFRWLPLTEANLAQLQVTIPRGVAGRRLPAGTGILFWQVVRWGK
jgi:hypothetical protein